MNVQPMDYHSLSAAFAPLYSYQFPAWWQTATGVFWISGIGCFVVGALGYFAWYRWWYKPPLTLEQWRDRELVALQRLLDKKPVDYKRFFGATTFFLKQYLLRLYGWRILDKTDDELLVFIKQKKAISAALCAKIAELLSYAQMVKFADHTALSEKADEAVVCVGQVVKKLKPIEQKNK